MGAWRSFSTATLLSSLALVGGSAGIARADSFTYANDPLRTGWYADQPDLSATRLTDPATVADPATRFGQVFDHPVSGKVYAQPLVADNTLLVATENNWIYGLDPGNGAEHWARQVGVPWSPPAGCTDLVPTVGVTGTPVIDPDTGTAYFFAKSYVSGTSGPAQWQAHGVDLQTGEERPGFPVSISGPADNRPGTSFNADAESQRAGLLLLHGVVYAAFAGHCDLGVYQGWVIGVPTYKAAQPPPPAGLSPTARWVSQASSDGETGGGIWQSGGGLVSDGPGQLLFASGNGASTSTPTPGASPPSDLGDSVVRLQVQASGALQAVDFFTPSNAQYLQAADADLGSGGVVALPTTPFGATPNLLLAAGKEGTVYVLNRDALGGFEQGPAGGDAAVQELHAGPSYSRPAVWPGDGGHVYLPSVWDRGPCTAGSLRYFSQVTGGLTPALALSGSVGGFGFGSGAPVVTSASTTDLDAVLWTTWAPVPPAKDPWQLRAYSAVPGTSPALLWSAPIGDGTKFAPPGVANGHVYVGTSDGHLRAFAAGGTLPQTGGSHPFGCEGDGPGVEPVAAPSLTPTRSVSPQSLPLARLDVVPKPPTVTSTTAQSGPSGSLDPRVHPLLGNAHTVFALHLIAAQVLNARTADRYRVLISGPSRRGCDARMSTVVSRAQRGQRLSVALIPGARGGWCPGTFRGQVLLERLVSCPSSGRPRSCSRGSLHSTALGRFSFRVT